MPYKYVDSLRTPSDETVVWRYMSHTKFVDLLSRKALFFREVNQYQKDDFLEGTMPLYDSTHKGNGYLLINGRQADLLDKKKSVELIGHLTCINCWGMDKREIAKKWNTFARMEKSIVIKSTIGNIKKSVASTNYDIHIGKIKYIDHSQYRYEEPNPFGYFMLKDKFQFEWEHEVRLLTISNNNNDYTKTDKIDLGSYEKFQKADISHMNGINHIYVPVDLNFLIGSIYISPWANLKYKEEIQELLERHSLYKKVYSSYYKGTYDDNQQIIKLRKY